MYRQVETSPTIQLDNGAYCEPVATLKADKGEFYMHIWMDDGCYCFGSQGGFNGMVHRHTHISRDLFDVLKTLPTPGKLVDGVLRD